MSLILKLQSAVQYKVFVHTSSHRPGLWFWRWAMGDISFFSAPSLPMCVCVCVLLLLLLFSCSVVCLTLCNPMDCSKPGFPVHYLPEFAHSGPSCWWCHPTISSSVVPFSSCLQLSPASGFFPVNQLLTSGGQSIGASASVLPTNIHCVCVQNCVFVY